MKTIAIAIRSHNDIEFVRKTLEAIFNQTLTAKQVCVFDNASTDGTREILNNYKQLEIFDIPQGEYVAGRVLNFAASKCNADIIVFNNMDAVPQNKKWLENLVSPIISGKAQATYARQIARKDALLWVSRDYENAFPKVSAHSKAFFSMASSAVACDVFKKISFDESLKFSEDVMFAKNLRERGMSVAYVNNAIVEHSHNYDLSAIARRFFGEGEADAVIIGGRYSIFQTAIRFLSDVFKDCVYAIKCKRFCSIFETIKARYIQKKSYFKGRNSKSL